MYKRRVFRVESGDIEAVGQSKIFLYHNKDAVDKEVCETELWIDGRHVGIIRPYEKLYLILDDIGNIDSFEIKL